MRQIARRVVKEEKKSRQNPATFRTYSTVIAINTVKEFHQNLKCTLLKGLNGQLLIIDVCQYILGRFSTTLDTSQS